MDKESSFEILKDKLQTPEERALLYSDAFEEVVYDLRKDGIGKIKNLILREYELRHEIKEGEKKLAKLKGGLDKVLTKSSQLKSGDLSALFQKEQNDQNENN